MLITRLEMPVEVRAALKMFREERHRAGGG